MSNKNHIQLPVQFVKPVFKADRSVRLEFETGEMSGSDIAKLSDYRQTIGYLTYSPEDDVSVEDIPEVMADPDLDKKSPSQRLRDVLWVYWNQGQKKTPWEQFYLVQMNRLIDNVKEHLEPQ